MIVPSPLVPNIDTTTPNVVYSKCFVRVTFMDYASDEISLDRHTSKNDHRLGSDPNNGSCPFTLENPYSIRSDMSGILKHLLQHGDGVMRIDHDPIAKTLFVHVERSKIISHGNPSISRMLQKIHVWHSTADVQSCRPFYELLSAVDGEYEVWR